MNQDQKHYKPGSPIPMEFNDPGLRKREMPPRRGRKNLGISPATSRMIITGIGFVILLFSLI